MTDPLSGLDDASLIRQSLQGGEAGQAAFKELYLRYEPQVFRFVMQLIRNYHDAENIAVDVLFQASKELDKFRGDSTFLTFLNGIAKYRCRNHWRSVGKQRKVMKALTDPSLAPEPPPTPPEILIRAEDHQRVKDAINKLEEPFRKTMWLRWVEGKSYKEIAEIMGCPIGTVESRLDRGFEDVRKLLTENSDDV